MRLTPEQRLALIDHINALVQVDFERLGICVGCAEECGAVKFCGPGRSLISLVSVGGESKWVWDGAIAEELWERSPHYRRF